MWQENWKERSVFWAIAPYKSLPTLLRCLPPPTSGRWKSYTSFKYSLEFSSVRSEWMCVAATKQVNNGMQRQWKLFLTSSRTWCLYALHKLDQLLRMSATSTVEQNRLRLKAEKPGSGYVRPTVACKFEPSRIKRHPHLEGSKSSVATANRLRKLHIVNMTARKICAWHSRFLLCNGLQFLYTLSKALC